MGKLLDYKKGTFGGDAFALEIIDCPRDLILFAASLSSDNVTIENFRNYYLSDTFDFEIKVSKKNITPRISKFDIDFNITKIEFIDLIELWDKNGCYALFHDSPLLKFRATDLDELTRYKVLSNFGWTLELAVPGPASSGLAHITSPHLHIIDQIEDRLKNSR